MQHLEAFCTAVVQVGGSSTVAGGLVVADGVSELKLLLQVCCAVCIHLCNAL
jgi:hypothetical protein